MGEWEGASFRNCDFGLQHCGLKGTGKSQHCFFQDGGHEDSLLILNLIHDHGEDWFSIQFHLEMVPLIWFKTR